ncbi:GPW/gp25 family protein [Plesiomonas shigelloides subsp. oncorhynchi]|nr:GPW/gp25 family protein [Plesiomonas shigelloides]
MNRRTGQRITELEHIRQSMADILGTPVGTRIARREYGSIVPELIDQPQNAALRLQLMAASYSAITRWEPRVQLQSIQMNTDMNGTMAAEMTGVLTDGTFASLSVPLKGHA